MAGQRKGVFRELISPFLRSKLEELERQFGVESRQYQAIARQYLRTADEDVIDPRSRRRHYEAEMSGEERGASLRGVERLYRRTVLLEPTTACMAHCRWCLRGQYDIMTLLPSQIDAALEYFAADPEIREVLITGGDPFTAAPILSYVLDAIESRVPSIEVVRIGSRVPMQEPARVSGMLLEALQRKRRYRLEVGVNICHPLEFWPESVAVLQVLMDAGIRVYNQHPLLKGVNDDVDTLVELYDRMRHFGIEAHYLFHAIPMRGMDHHRTSLRKGLELISSLTAGGQFSGRAKPHYCAMTDIGKIVLYEGSVLKRDEATNTCLLRSAYTLEDRLRYNPSWRRPDSVELNEDGTMNVWYPDGVDDYDPAWRGDASQSHKCVMVSNP